MALAVALAFAEAGAGAATITVTDGGDAGTGSTCTLRQAIVSANKNAHGASSCIDGNGDDTIVFDDALVGSTITLSGTELTVTSPLTIGTRAATGPISCVQQARSWQGDWS